MILRSIQLEGFKCFASPVRVAGFSERLNVLHAPNGTGKSTLFDALSRALFDDHRVSGKDADALRPWGRALAPQVIVDFAHNGEEYRLTKRFLDEPRARLERLESGGFKPLAEGDKCVERARQLLASTGPGRGLSQLKNWGFAQILWAAQGSLGIPELTGDLISELQRRLGHSQSTSDHETGPLEQQIEDLFSRFFTAQGKLKSGKDGAPALALRKAMEEASERETASAAAHLRYEEAVRRLEDLRAASAQTRRYELELDRAVEKARAEAQEHEKLLSARREVKARTESLELEFKALNERYEDLKRLRASRFECDKRLELQQVDDPLHERELAERLKEEASTQKALEDARLELDRADRARSLADLARRFVEDRDKLEVATKRLQEIAAQRKLAEIARGARRELMAPDAKTLQLIRKAAQEKTEVELRLEAALTTLQIVPECTGTLEVLVGETPGTRTLEPGTPVEVKGSPQVAVDVPGFGRIRARGPEGSAQELREKREETLRRLALLTRPFGTQAFDSIEKLFEQAAVLEQEAHGQEERLSALCGSSRIEDLEQARRLLESAIEATLLSHADWRTSPPDAQAMKQAAEKLLEDCVVRVRKLENARLTASQASSASREKRSLHTAAIEQTRKNHEEITRSLAKLELDQRSDAEREADINRAALQARAARAELEQLAQTLTARVGDPLDALSRLEKSHRKAQEAKIEAQSKEMREEGSLSILAQQGTYSALVAAQENRAALGEKLAREEERMEAIWLLRETVRASRDEARAALTAPIRRAATRTLERIAGRRLGTVEMTEGLGPAHVLPEEAGAQITLDRVSGGEREQIHFALRLALADVLAKGERHLVVLDDVFGSTDSARLSRIGQVLEDAAERLQVLVITCHPERFRGLEDAVFLDLEEIVRAGADGASRR